MKKIKAVEFIKKVTQLLDSYPISVFLKQLPDIIHQYLPLSEVVFYYRNSRGDSFVPFTEGSDSCKLVEIKETSRIISAFTKNKEPFFLGEKESIYMEIFNKETENLLKHKNINIILPLHFKNQMCGLIFAHMEKKDKKLSMEIVNTLNLVKDIFIPRIEIERIELTNDRNYYKLFRFDRLVLLGEMVASFAHEFRTPLQTVQLEIRELADSLQPHLKDGQVFDKLYNQISRLRQLINSLLSFSKVQAISRENFHLKPYIDMLLQDIPKKKIPKGVTIEKRISDDASVYSDKNRLRQVITNILFNALDVISDDGKIVIEAYMESKGSERGKTCIISIEDNGPGIPQPIKERIFEPFFTTKETGTGLGLYISYGIMESLKGSLEIESSERGTTFFIHLPVAKTDK
jgi:signal transduction histidine kinase